MTEVYIDKDYAYAVARIRGAELSLLSHAVLEQLIAAKSADEALRILSEQGFGAETSKTPEEMLRAEREKLWSLIDELVPDAQIFDVFRLPNDYNNLKAAIKESTMEFPYEGIYIEEATVSPVLVREAVRERNYGMLPEEMRELAEHAHDVFLRTGDGQLCDILIDRACLDAIGRAGKKSGNEIIALYAELLVVQADIKTAVRAAAAGKNGDFLSEALSPCGTLDVERLKTAALSGQEAVNAYLLTTDYADAAEELKISPAAFERWCDNLIIRRMRSQLFESFGLGPVAAYILAKENEIKSVRILLSGKQNGFPEEMIRERVRETYV